MLEELISKILPGDLIPLTAIALGIAAGLIITVTGLIAGTVRRIRERQMAMDLIHDLVDRGLATEEVERLVLASATEESDELKGLAARQG